MRQHAEGEREHAEEDAGVAHHEPAEGKRDDEPGQRRAEEHDLELLDAPHPGDDGSAVGAEPEEHRVPEGEQAAIAEEQIESQERNGIAVERHQQVGVEGRRQDRD